MALIACVLWIAGFEVLPWMHVATHGHIGAHHHDENGATIFDAGPSDHHRDHDDDHDAEIDEHGEHHDNDADEEVDEHAPHHHVADHHHDDDVDDDIDEHARDAESDHHASNDHHDHDTGKHHDDAETWLADALAHGRHSLAHHDIAISTPPPFLTSPLPINRRATFVLEETAVEPISFSPGRAVARGPPGRSRNQVI